MPAPLFDRGRLRFRPLARAAEQGARRARPRRPDRPPAGPERGGPRGRRGGRRGVRAARAAGRPVILAFGAHAIKNGLAPVLIRLIEAGLAHAPGHQRRRDHPRLGVRLPGQTSEDVRENVARGQFGIWQETGACPQPGPGRGGLRGAGLRRVGRRLIQRRAWRSPERRSCGRPWRRRSGAGRCGAADGSAAAAPGRWSRPPRRPTCWPCCGRLDLPPGFLAVPHPWKRFGVQAAACRLGVPFTGHPMFGHDIIYTHPHEPAAPPWAGRPSAISWPSPPAWPAGRRGIPLGGLGGDVADDLREVPVDGPEPRRCAEGRRIERLPTDRGGPGPAAWDWQRQGEPPPDHPAYYLR